MISTNNKDNADIPDDFKQVCVWPGTIVKPEQISEFEEYFALNGFRVVYLESIMTSPDRDEDGCSIEDTGGRIDALFTVHNDDILKFAIPRLQMGIRWIEDVLDNELEHSIYPDRIKEYRTW